MMEVKQNTAVDLNELLVPSKAAEGADEMDDAIMTDLSDEAASQDLNCDLIQTNEKSSNNGLVVVQNGNEEALTSLMNIDTSEATTGLDDDDDDAPVSTELEDVLLAEDDVVLPNVNATKISCDTSPSVADDDILADKVETSNSTTCSSDGRDPGDDLDTLLSKINDIVDDCLEKEGGDAAAAVIAVPEEIEEIVEEIVGEDVEEIVGEDVEEIVEENVQEIVEENVHEIVEDNVVENVEENVEEKEEIDKDISAPVDSSCEILDDSVMSVGNQPTDDENDVDHEDENEDEIDGDNVDVNDDAIDGENDVENDETATHEMVGIKETADTQEPPKPETLETVITADNSEVEVDSTKQQINETLIEETITEVEEPVVLPEITPEQPENVENFVKNQSETEDIITSEEEQKEAVVDNAEKIPEEPKDISADIVKVADETSSPRVEQHTTNAGLEETLANKQDAQGGDSLENESMLNKEETSKLDSVEQINQNQDTKVVTEDNKVEVKDNENVDLETLKKKVDDTKHVDEDVEKEKETNNKKEEITIEDTKKDDKDNEESDDEIVFYVDDKPTEEANKQKEKVETAKINSSAISSTKQLEEDKDKIAIDDDDIVILDDDDEGMNETDKKVVESEKELATEVKSQSGETKKTDDCEKKTSSSSEVAKESINETPKHSTNLDMDNSDNARDEFVTDNKLPATPNSSNTTTAITSTGTEESVKPQEIEETNSNCSSSSNLLLEAKANDNSIDAGNQEDNENDNEEDDDDGDGDVELIENESKEAENSSEKGDELAPPAKRQRLSEDSQVSSNVDETSSKSQKTATESAEEKSETQDVEKTSLSTATSLKRSHDVIELELDDKSNDSKVSASTESLTKKARTEEKAKEQESAAAEASEVKTTKEEVEDSSTEDKVEIKTMIPSYKPIPLYPPPKLETLKSENTFSLDFLKKFRKSFDKMTKQDLEEMVLQKVVEAIIHKSEFADMRDLIEKQEKLISSHRTKITELSKQFRDLEMVHNRVVKDIEQRNSQFIMPVKITRAVGLQVYIPNKKSILEAGTTSSSSTGVSAIPASSPQRSITAAAQSILTSPQRPLLSSASQTADAQSRSSSGNTLSSAVSAAITNAVRRGCAQKITPTRPVPSSSSGGGGNSTPSGGTSTSSSTTTTVYRSNSNQTQTSSQPRILNKNATVSSSGGGVTNSPANASNIQRNRYIPSNLETMRLQQQQTAASRPAANSQRVVVQPKPTSSNTTIPRRSEPAASTASTPSNNTPSLDSYMNTLSQLTGGNTAVSITPAKPKEKAVIDLTDEDEVVPATGAAAAAAANTTTNSTASTNNGPATAANPTQRRILPSQTNNTSSSSQFARNAPPLARIPPSNQMTNSNKSRQTAAVQGQKSTNSTFASSISTPAGTSITRINVTANTQNPQRVKYSHPAPLPATPPQAFNPSWKLPPPRPTIRISNLDNGIVISWTMEESMDRHAECVSYQIYAYQETSGPPMADSWRHVGDVKAMLLPMAVTLTQFQEGQRYFFAVRAVDCHQRYGPFSLPKTWS